MSAVLKTPEDHRALRFLTAGSVDDGYRKMFVLVMFV
jgi:sulfate adenylyltransferase subunit 1 (EFTu-like GTPase family)